MLGRDSNVMEGWVSGRGCAGGGAIVGGKLGVGVVQDAE